MLMRQIIIVNKDSPILDIFLNISNFSCTTFTWKKVGILLFGFQKNSFNYKQYTWKANCTVIHHSFVWQSNGSLNKQTKVLMARPEITLKFANIQEFTCSCFSGGGTGEQYLRNTGWRSQQKVTGERNLCKCLPKEHNTMSLTRAQALTARCRGEHTNQEATALLQLRLKRVATLTIFATKSTKSTQ